MTKPVVDITHRLEFSACHRLASPALSDAENEAIYGACYRRHGHNYVVEVTVRGSVQPRTGMVMNLVDLMQIMRNELFDAVDHRDLNTDVPFLEGVIPTAENIVVAFWERLEPHVESHDSCRLHRIRLHESRDNLVEYYGPTSRASRT